jgi:hypothetical protein
MTCSPYGAAWRDATPCNQTPRLFASSGLMRWRYCLKNVVNDGSRGRVVQRHVLYLGEINDTRELASAPSYCEAVLRYALMRAGG